MRYSCLKNKPDLIAMRSNLNDLIGEKQIIATIKMVYYYVFLFAAPVTKLNNSYLTKECTFK